MSQQQETTGKTLLVAFILCVVCSAIVSTTAVMMKPRQQAEKEQDRIRNILAIAGLLQEGVSVQEQFKQITPKVMDFETGKFTDAMTVEQVLDPKKLTKSDATSTELSDEQDVAKIGRREHYGVVYLVQKEGHLEKIILPIRGYGLWSTLWGFVALEADLNTVSGFGYYQQAETPGLGGEVDNPLWKALWPGKQIYNTGHEVVLKIIKGKVNPSAVDAKHQVDGLSGATLTSRGVQNMMHFWMGKDGYSAFLQHLKNGEA
jgi:Na+-transporting NADH:ubiquinone oxidoreductase subunit C